jgi:hypothetical protein
LFFCLSSRFVAIGFLFVILQRSEGSAVAFALACSPDPTPLLTAPDKVVHIILEAAKVVLS